MSYIVVTFILKCPLSYSYQHTNIQINIQTSKHFLANQAKKIPNREEFEALRVKNKTLRHYDIEQIRLGLMPWCVILSYRNFQLGAREAIMF